MSSDYTKPNWAFEGTTPGLTGLILENKLDHAGARAFNQLPRKSKVVLGNLPPFNSLPEVKMITLEEKIFSMLNF